MIYNKYIAFIFIVLAIILIYGKTIQYDYAIDDSMVVRDNTIVAKGVSSIGEIFASSYLKGYDNPDKMDGVYRPIPLATLALTISVFGNNPKPHHIINILLFILVAFLLFQFLSNLFKNNLFIAFSITLIWVVLPVNIEVVANIKSRDEILALIFILSSISLALKNNIYFNICSGAALLFAMMCKESSIAFIVLIPLILYLKSYSKKHIYKTIAILGSSITILFLIRYRVLDNYEVLEIKINNNVFSFTGVERWYYKLFLILEYIRLYLFPTNLSWDYNYGYHEIKSYLLEALFTLLLIFASVYMFIITIKQKSYYSLFIAWFYICLLVVSNTFYLIGTTMADRLLFTPSIGITVIIVMLLYNYLSKYDIKVFWLKLPSLLVLVFVVYYTFLSMNRVEDWKNDYTLIKSDYENGNTNFKTIIGLIKMTTNRIEKNKSTKLIEQGNKLSSDMVRLYPKFEDTYKYTALFYQKVHNYKESIKMYNIALQYDARNIEYYWNLGLMQYELKDFNNAITSFTMCLNIDLNPVNPSIYSLCALSYHQINNYDKAIEYYQKSLELDSNQKFIKMNLDKLLKRQLNKLKL